MLMDILIVLAVALEAYLLGSIDTGILVSRLRLPRRRPQARQRRGGQ